MPRSQQALYGTCKSGKRPEFTQSARGETAQALYEFFVQEVKKMHTQVQTGVFAASMHIELLNDGPVTLIIDK